ncbi:MAG: hypothetical protein LBL00_05870, partial [Endomicrobium sp.]|nr:hypothetical protein [Endomicrobium sp.]
MILKKFTAILTAVCFLTSFAGGSFAQTAVSQDAKQSVVFDTIKPDIVAEKFGKITEFENYDSRQVIINVQDLHAHPQTQKNIASILQTLDEKYTVKTVYLEGADGKVDVSWLSLGNDPGLNKNIALQMLENGDLTGAEYFAFLNNKNNLFGLEDAEVHRRNIVRLGSIYENEEKNIRIAANVKNEINYLVNKNLAPEMKRFLKAASAYHENKMEAAKYYGILLNYADKINGSPLNYENAFNVDPEEFTEIQKVVFIDELSKKLNSKRVNAELQQYLSSLKDILSVSQYYALLEATDNLNDIDMFFKYVSSYDLGKKEGSQLKAFIKLKELNSQINPLDLFKQEQKLEELVRRALSSSDLETETAFLNDFYSYFEGYLTNKLTAKDEEYFKTNFKTFSALYGKYASVNHISEIKNQFAFLDDYYNTNNKRNEIFIQKITENDKLVSGNARLPQSPENMLNNAKEIIVIVTGGYHTRGVSEILDAKKISHITITPKISEGTSLSDINYRQIILDQSRIYKEALAFVIASQTTDVVRFLNSIKAGVAYLSKDATFDDIDALMGEINGVSAGAALVRPDNDNAEITFQNGAKIFLSRGADNKIVVDTKKSTPAENVSEDAVKISDKTVIDAYFGLAKTLVPEAFKSLYSVAVLDIKSEPIYQAAKEFFAAQVKDGADFDVDGAIPALEEYASYRAESDGQTTDQVKASLLVDGIDYESLSRMPEFFQKEALERQINKDISDSKTPAKQQSVLRTILTGLKMLVPMLFFFVAVLVSACDSRPSQQSGKQQTDISVSASDKKVPAQVVDYVAKSEVAARRFIVTNKDGQLIDYTIKGVCYSRDLNGREFYNNYKKDIELMQSLGVNSIRTYRPLAAYTVGGALDVKGTREMLDAFQKAGITVTVGFSYEDMIINGLMGLYLDAFGDHPAIVMFAMGNEYNYHEEWFSKAAWLDRLTNGIRRAKEVAPNKVIAVVHGEIPSVQEVEEFQEAGVDIVLLNIYRGPSFTDLFDQLKDLIAKTGMRFGLGECGKGSKGANGEDMFELQADFLESQLKEIQEAVEQGVIVGFYIFELRDEGWKEGFSEIIGDEAHIGLFDNDGNPKPVVAVIIKMLSGKFLSFFITEMPNVVESASAEGQEAQKKETQPSITKEQIIKTEKVVKMYENERKDDKEEPNWRAYALPLGMISIDEQGALVLEIETINAAPNSTMRIEIRNLDENGAPILNPNVLLKDSYDLAEKGGSVTVKIPGSHFSRLDLNKPIQVVISVGEVFEGKDLNTEDAVIDITYAAVALAKSTESAESSKSAPLELPFFAYILNKLGITKQKFPKIRTAIIVGLETTLIILLPPKVFSMLHGKNVQSVTEARTAAVQKMKREAIERMSRPMVNGLVYITVAGVVGGILYGL